MMISSFSEAICSFKEILIPPTTSSPPKTGLQYNNKPNPTNNPQPVTTNNRFYVTNSVSC